MTPRQSSAANGRRPARKATGRATGAALRAKAAGRGTRAPATPATSSPRENAERVDGRRLRAQRNREAVVRAILQLVKEGNLRPRAPEVALRAGVSERTVFRHFADLDSLFIAASEQQRPTLDSYLNPRPSGDLEARIEAFVRLRARLYEEITPVRRAASLVVPFHPLLAERLEDTHRQAREQLLEVFAPEIERREGERREALVETLDVLTSWPAWDVLRHSQRLPVARARRVLAAAIEGLLKGI